MTVRRPRLALLGAVLALLAMAGLNALSIWHSSNIHHDDIVHVASDPHAHPASGDTDSDAPIHVMAHAASQWLPAVELPAFDIVISVTGSAWPRFDPILSLSHDPSQLLRPPRG